MIDAIGLAAGLFVILAFYAKTAVWLRRYAIMSNLLFVAYAIGGGLWPILILHALLLPLNLRRLMQLHETAAPRQSRDTRWNRILSM